MHVHNYYGYLFCLSEGSNILLKLTCNCPSAIECSCRGRGSVTALLSDFDLIEKATNDGKWARLSDHEPSGTNGMKALEVMILNMWYIFIVSHVIG